MNCYDYILQNLHKISFSNQLIKSHPKETYDPFVIKDTYIDATSGAYINLEEVVGTDHGDYATKTWENAVQNLKREYSNLSTIQCTYENNSNTRVKNLIFYNADASTKKNLGGDDPWSADIYQLKEKNECYITQGNNRTIVAKFLYGLNKIEKIIPVTRSISVKKIDMSAMQTYDKIMKKFGDDIERDKLYLKCEKKLITDKNQIREYEIYMLATFMYPIDKWAQYTYRIEDSEQQITLEMNQRKSFLQKILFFFKRH